MVQSVIVINRLSKHFVQSKLILSPIDVTFLKEHTPSAQLRGKTSRSMTGFNRGNWKTGEK